jgi:hypothetical protein
MNTKEENRLPKEILDKGIRRSNEIGWKEQDFIEVVEAAREIPMAIRGGQVQYIFPDGTCELYWLKYDPKPREHTEEWAIFCNRSINECIEKFRGIITTTNFDKEELEWDFLRIKKESGINMSNHRVFILYFDDMGIE